MASDLKQQLFAKLTKPTLTPFEFCGVPCFIRQWSERERIEWAMFVKTVDTEDQSKGSELACRAIAASLADPDGQLLFGADELGTVANFAANEVAHAFNAILEQQTSSPVDAKKNSANTPGSSSISSSLAS